MERHEIRTKPAHGLSSTNARNVVDEKPGFVLVHLLYQLLNLLFILMEQRLKVCEVDGDERGSA